MRSLAIVVVLVTVAGRAHAETPTRGAAKQLLTRGVAAFRSGDHAEALRLFRAAYSAYRSPKLLLNIGTTFKALHRDVDAANTYQRYLDTSSASTVRRAEVITILAALDRKLARLSIVVLPGGAVVSINGISQSPSQLLRVLPGRHLIRASAVGYHPRRRRVRVRAGEHQRVALTLHKQRRRRAGARRVVARVAANLDYRGRGAGLAVGVGLFVLPVIEVSGGALVNGASKGGYVSITAVLGNGRVTPTLSLMTPTLFSDGVRYAVRSALGLRWRISPRVGAVVELGVEHYLNPLPMQTRTIAVPVIGLQARL